MKKIVPIILIFLALTHIGGVMPLYFCALEEVKTEMQLELGNTEQLQKIIVTQQEYHDVATFRMCEEHEFFYRGNMFDFKSVELQTSGDYIFYALQDNKETTLIVLLKTVFNYPEDKTNQTPLGNLLKNFVKDFVGTFPSSFLYLFTSPISFLPVKYGLTVLDGYSSEISPPPDQV